MVASTTSAELRAIAPEAFAAFDVVLASAHAHGPLAAMAGANVAGALGDETVDAVATDPAIATFASQFVVDVGAITDDSRQAATSALLADAFEFVQLLYVFDWSTRLRYACRQLFDVDPLTGDAQPESSLWKALEAMFTTVARLRALDPLTTELVRLRGARAHRCR